MVRFLNSAWLPSPVEAAFPSPCEDRHLRLLGKPVISSPPPGVVLAGPKVGGAECDPKGRLVCHYTGRNLGRICGDGSSGGGTVVEGTRRWVGWNLLIWAQQQTRDESSG